MKHASGPLNELESLATHRESVANVRMIAAKTRCAYSLFTNDRPAADAFVARAEKWVLAADARLTAEDIARADVIVPICEAKWSYDNAMLDIAREKANPSGVRDLRAMHAAGSAAQAAQQQMDALKPRYLAHRKRPFTNWRSEGACVATVRASQ